MDEFVGLVAIVMTFGIPMVAILGGFSIKKTKIKAGMVKDQLELERLKHENYLIETEKMRLELEKMRLEEPKDNLKL
ncbi:hypothetical protein RCG24_17695 [Neobacillus sp. OS1-32]|uniref:Uncharacterized protein n=1 Tax=Neobacillus paridis TaxID=2803862 RepID=A0ABS1TPC9_9BACI|nr:MULTISPECIES: hypothetical protein [Neobacillus]MBL4953183.1 hypothetical protein [Neobacillus paridis]WML29730.1 hypothetical protein RCG24_17695 [Neobacillus sp. OS1-32]